MPVKKARELGLALGFACTWVGAMEHMQTLENKFCNVSPVDQTRAILAWQPTHLPYRAISPASSLICNAPILYSAWQFPISHRVDCTEAVWSLSVTVDPWATLLALLLFAK